MFINLQEQIFIEAYFTFNMEIEGVPLKSHLSITSKISVCVQNEVFCQKDKTEVNTKHVKNDVIVDNEQGNFKTNVNRENVWQKVKPKNKRKKEKMEEVFLEDVGPDDDNDKDIHEAILLVGSKNSGHRRSNPQETPVLNVKADPTYKCDQCKSVLESQGLLNAQLSSQHTLKPNHTCRVCTEEFSDKKDLEKHMTEHNEILGSDQWNCNDCAFQAESALELMKHLKVTGQQPSQSIKD